jgi:hypothetical protein
MSGILSRHLHGMLTMNEQQGDKPNLDLIQMVQRARMLHDADVKRQQGEYPALAAG